MLNQVSKMLIKPLQVPDSPHHIVDQLKIELQLLHLSIRTFIGAIGSKQLIFINLSFTFVSMIPIIGYLPDLLLDNRYRIVLFKFLGLGYTGFLVVLLSALFMESFRCMYR